MSQAALISAPAISRNGIFFWLLRTPVGVRYPFFVTAVLFGLNIRSKLAFLVWVVVTFVAVLLHELGHAMAARAFGQTPRIELHGFGGSTHGAWGEATRWYERVIICLAGPGIGFVIGGLEYLRQTSGADPDFHLLRLASHYFL